jgi:hypothetical protein
MPLLSKVISRDEFLSHPEGGFGVGLQNPALGHFVKHLQNRIPCLLADLSILEMLDADHEALISKLRATQEWIFKRVIRPT